MGNRRSLGGLTVGTFAVLVLTFIELAAGQSSLPSSRYSPSSRASYQGFSPYGFYESPESEVLPTLSRNLEQPMGSAMGNDAGGQVIQDGPVLSLVDCEPASDEEDGLSCDKEGFFITGFDREGEWLGGGGLVPLSKATCCRIAPPKSFPEFPGYGNVKPTSVVSVGCHESSGRQKDSVKCEGAGSSYVRGFADSAKVNAVSPYSYPLGPVSCCTPAVLLSNGDLWSTKRCGCTEVSHASCDAEDGQSTHLLVEFRQARESRSGDFVPIAPVTCCKACLGSKIMDTTCSDLNKCSGNGRCTFGACECISGWTGPDCSLRQSGGSGLLQWQVAMFIVGGLGIAASILVFAGHIYATYGRLVDETEEEEMQEALLLRMHDDNGSVGSDDTSDEEEGSDAVEDRAEPEAEVPDAQIQRGQINRTEPDQDENDEFSADRVVSGDHEEPLEREMVSLDVEPAADCCTDEEPLEEVYGDCNICFSRPIQVVVVPCGHACMCRRCSRRVARCPICRTEVVRRQRLFMGK